MPICAIYGLRFPSCDNIADQIFQNGFITFKVSDKLEKGSQKTLGYCYFCA